MPPQCKAPAQLCTNAPLARLQPACNICKVFLNHESPLPMRRITSTLRVRTLALALCGPGVLLPAAWAQSAPPSVAGLDTVIVTGTRARDRTELTTPACAPR